MYKLKVKITKEVLRKSMYCGTSSSVGAVYENCGVAVAVRDIFPNAKVMGTYFLANGSECLQDRVNLPLEVTQFIREFDSLAIFPMERLRMNEFEFEVEIPDSVIDTIDIAEVKEVLTNHHCLELKYEEVIKAL